METREYYIEEVFTRPHNKKTQALDESLKGLKGAMVTFSDDFTQEMMMERMTEITKAANAAGRGKDIEVSMWDNEYTGTLNVSFRGGSPYGDSATIRMSPVMGHIASLEDLDR